MGQVPDKYRPDLTFIGPPVGWFGPTHKIMGHVSLLNRFVNQTDYPEGLTNIYGIGQCFETTKREVQ